MQRQYITYLQAWKTKKNRKPLIVNGARQVGKTYLLKEFGKKYFKNHVYINFETSTILPQVLQQGYNIANILAAIQAETGIKPIAGKTLIIFDEVQLQARALTALKYFYENANEYHVVCAGSLLGLALANASAFPVGKVEFLDMYPLSFLEFLEAIGETELQKIIVKNNWQLINAFKEKYQTLLRQYYFIGGMPEAVADFCQNQSFENVRLIQQNILRTYELDFSKHAPSNIVPRIRMLWQNIPTQLAKENKKFIYKAVKSGSRAKDYELALHWLIDAGLVHKVCNVNSITKPLKVYEDAEAFKLYILDTGLLCAMSNIDAPDILHHNADVTQFKGAITEQFVLQQLVVKNKLYYWSPTNVQAEVDFIIEKNSAIWPLEVKAEENLQAKSLRVYYTKHKPKYAVRTSMSNYREDDWLVNIPLWAISEFAFTK